jgi:hypothetical protein
MSCFVVEHESVQKMCATVCGMSLRKELPKTIFFNTKEVILAFRYMYRLNFIAYASRYDEEPMKELTKYVEDILPIDIDNYKCEDLNIFQLLKSLDCISYQCEEDIIDIKPWMAPTLKKFKELRIFLMEKIVEELPEYKKAEWK